MALLPDDLAAQEVAEPLEEVDDVAQPDELVAKSLRGDVRFGLQLQTLGGSIEHRKAGGARCGLVGAVTHAGIYTKQMCVMSRRQV